MTQKHSRTLETLLAAAVARLASARRTFTDEEALAEIWEAGYDFSPQGDDRFALARETDGRTPRHWRLADQVVANHRLLEALLAEEWDGRGLDAELHRLSEVAGVPHVFCPVDPRFVLRPDGTLEPADREDEAVLSAASRAGLDALREPLLRRWQEEGGAPRTVHQLTQLLGELGWPLARRRDGWLQARAWLGEQSVIARVGRDYWVPADRLPAGPTRTRLQVVPVWDREPAQEQGEQEPGVVPPAESEKAGVVDADRAPLVPDAGPVEARWTVALRTVHLVEGFLPVPAEARRAYPPRSPRACSWEALRGKWFETGDDLWVWLDRQRDLLCGPDLADRLAWCEAGEKRCVVWAAESVVFRSAGIDEEVQREEGRLADREALAELRGGLGESYRQSLAAILRSVAGGLTFAELLQALGRRQGHDMHRGTVRAVLHAGGFICDGRRWSVAGGDEEGARRFRRALAQTLVEEAKPSLRQVANAVKQRLQGLIDGV